MKALKSYLSAIDPRLLNHITGKPKQFIRLFQQQIYLSEDVFIQRVCGKKYDRVYYRGLKSRTIKILQALAIVSTPKEDSLVKKKYEICQKNFLIGQKILGKKDRAEGIRLIKQAYHIAVEYDFLHFVCECSSVLYHNHVYHQRNTKKVQFYREQMKTYLEAYKAEKMAEYYFFDMVELMNRTSVEPEQFQHVVNEIEKLQGVSIKYTVYKAFMAVFHGFHIGDYHQVIQNSTAALHHFENKKGIYTSHYYFFYKAIGIAQIGTAQYTEATYSFEHAGRYVTNAPINDYIIKFYQTLNALHSGQYQMAYNLYIQNKKCRFEVVKQQFAIIGAYLCFLSHNSYLSLEKPFRLGKYLNDTFKAQADKRGDNINILIAELLVYLVRNRGKFIDRVEAIKNYSYRYLKGEDTKRAKWFIRILCTLPRANFHPIALKRLAKKQIENLEQSNIRMGENFAIEIIPFEDLLNMIISHLERKVA